MNLILMQNGFPAVIVLVNERKKYFRALEEADKGNYSPFVNLMSRFTENSLDLYLDSIGKARERQMPLSKLARRTPYSADYLSLLARRGELSASKRGKTWFSSLEAVKDYQKKRERKR